MKNSLSGETSIRRGFLSVNAPPCYEFAPPDKENATLYDEFAPLDKENATPCDKFAPLDKENAPPLQ